MPPVNDRQFADYTFDGKEPWEEVKLVAHPHWATLARPALGIASMWAVIGVLFYFYKASWVTGWAILWGLALSLIIAGYAFYKWYNTMAIITDHRVMQIRQSSLTSRTVAATMWSNIQSVTVSTEGVLASIFGFGMIICDPGGSELTVDLYAVPSVFGTQQLALTLMRRAQEEGLSGTRADQHERRKQAKKVFMD